MTTRFQRTEPRRRHRLTRLGFHFLFVGLFAMLGGAVRGFNLLLILAGLLVGALLVQWRWSRRTMEAIEIERRLPGEAFAGKAFRISYQLSNRSRLIPLWMLRVEDRIESATEGERATAICGVGVISPRKIVQSHCECTILQRGAFRFGPVTVSTSFPFALLSSQQSVEAAIDFYVYPRLLPLRKQWQRRLAGSSHGMTSSQRRSGSVEGDFYGLREWQTGDSPKWIHWRTTARLNELAVRQFEQQRRFDACFLVDVFGPDPVKVEAEEDAISLAASLLVNLVGQPSNRIVLAVAGVQSETVIGGGSIAGKRRMLESLAKVRPSRHPRLVEAANKAVQLVHSTRDLVVVSPRSMEEVQAKEPDLTSAIAPWKRRGSLRWINVTAPEFDQWVVRESVDANGVPSR